MKHTPGPWKWERRIDEGATIAVWSLRGPRVLCRWWEGIGHTEDAQADARLIAAAPELLDLVCCLVHQVDTLNYCEWCRQHAPRDRSGIEIIGRVKHPEDCTYVVARALLARIEGEDA